MPSVARGARHRETTQPWHGQTGTAAARCRLLGANKHYADQASRLSEAHGTPWAGTLDLRATRSVTLVNASQCDGVVGNFGCRLVTPAIRLPVRGPS